MAQNLAAAQPARPTVAVVIPFFNGSRWIERAIKSVYRQTVQPDEFVIVNDGSSRVERQVLEELSRRYSFKIVDQENGGQGAARNAGVAASTSDYICFLDQDDFYFPGHIEYLLDAIPENDPKFGFVYADFCMGDADGNIIRRNCYDGYGPHPRRTIDEILGNDTFALPSVSIYSRKAFSAVGGFDPQFRACEDDDLFVRLFQAGYSNHFLDRPVAVWCWHGDNTTGSALMTLSRLRFFKKLAASFPDDNGRSQFFFRDYFAPRFGRRFVREAIRAVESKSESREEINVLLKEFRNIVVANPSVSWKLKFKLTMATVMITVFRLPIYRF